MNDNSCSTFINYGCTNPFAENYNSYALEDDGSCIINGCTDPSAFNFNPIATYDNGLCYQDGITVTLGIDDNSLSNNVSDTPFGTYYEDNKNQYLFTSTELYSLGLASGELTSLAFNVINNAQQTINNFNIKIGFTDQTEITNFTYDLSGVYENDIQPVEVEYI